MAKNNKPKKATKKHGKRCKCDTCRSKRSAAKAERKRKARANRIKDYVVKGVPVRRGPNQQGFLAGGHQKMKRDWFLIGGDWEAPISSLHRRGRNIIKTKFPDGVYKVTSLWGTTVSNYRITNAFQIDLPRDEFDSMKEEGPQFGPIDYLWHGTKFKAVSSIAHNNLEVRGAHCLMGAGIYLAPDFEKSWNYSGGGWHNRNVTRTVLLCAVRLGKVWKAYTCIKTPAERGSIWKKQCDDKACDCKKRPNADICKTNGCDTAMMGAGGYTTAWGGRIRLGEYAVYDARQVLPLYAICFDPA